MKTLVVCSASTAETTITFPTPSNHRPCQPER
jgi:hypothetical protein